MQHISLVSEYDVFQELCVRPVVCISYDLREFLAYGTDASIAYVGDVPEIVPRIDKVCSVMHHHLGNVCSVVCTSQCFSLQARLMQALMLSIPVLSLTRKQ